MEALLWGSDEPNNDSKSCSSCHDSMLEVVRWLLGISTPNSQTALAAASLRFASALDERWTVAAFTHSSPPACRTLQQQTAVSSSTADCIAVVATFSGTEAASRHHL